MKLEDLRRKIEASPVLEAEKDPEKKEWLVKLMAAAGCVLFDNRYPVWGNNPHLNFSDSKTSGATAMTCLAQLLNICAADGQPFGEILISWDQSLANADPDIFNSESITTLVRTFTTKVLTASETFIERSEVGQWLGLRDGADLIIQYNADKKLRETIFNRLDEEARRNFSIIFCGYISSQQA